MIDAVQLPILLKAIDFVFEEGRKILDERRERRKMDGAAQDGKEEEPKQETALLEVQDQSEIKQDLLASKIEEKLWQNYEWEVESLVKRLEIQTKNYHHHQEQYAKWGSDLVPSVITHRITEAENALIETRKQLEVILSKVYKKDISPNK